MKLPHATSATIATEKLSEYLLSETHPVGKSKAASFRSLGFDSRRPEELRSALLSLAASEEVTARSASSRGTKYVVEGELRGPRRAAAVRTIWIVDLDSTKPRFVTAYPIRKEGTMKEHDLVVLVRGLEDTDLKPGDVGVIVGEYARGGYEVEFVNAAGDTLAVLTLDDSDIRPMSGSEILHVRDLAAL